MGIKEVLSAIGGAFSLGNVPLTPLPPPLLLTGGLLRPGMSTSKLAARIISRQSEAGAPVGALPDGSQSVAEAMEVIRVEEIINMLRTEAKVEVVIAPGVTVQTIGVGNLGIPVVSQGTIAGIGIGQGVVR